MKQHLTSCLQLPPQPLHLAIPAVRLALCPPPAVPAQVREYVQRPLEVLGGHVEVMTRTGNITSSFSSLDIFS
jgi:hypothetical protein